MAADVAAGTSVDVLKLNNCEWANSSGDPPVSDGFVDECCVRELATVELCTDVTGAAGVDDGW